MFFSILATILVFVFGQLWQLNKTLDETKSFEMRYRMIGLELPQVAKSIDSLYRINADKFDAKVKKREEEQRLRWSIKEKQREINELDRQ